MPEDMFKMQQDAIRRAREVYSRANSRPVTPQRQSPAPRSSPPQPEPVTEEKSLPEKEVTDVLASLFNDKDKTIILTLLLILAEEKCDNSLLFTLLYLLM